VTEQRLSRNALLAKYFAQQYKGVPRTKLMKFIYMSDVLGRQYLGKPLSQFRYIRYKYGPYAPAIETTVAELVAKGHATEEHDVWNIKSYYKRVHDLQQPVAFGFSLGESAVLDYVVKNYLDMNWEEFLHDVVYETLPMKRTKKKGEPLPMDLLNFQGSREVGFNIEEVLKAERDTTPGGTITLSEFLHELRAKAPA
jgi:hypothetical protein